MIKLWEYSRLYNCLRAYADFLTRRSYRPLRQKGSLPKDGAVIICPNHTNTLMDAMVVLQSRKEATVFGARADIFENPAAARALRFLRIVPMVRRRDGIRKVLRNLETLQEVTDVLDHGLPFCIFSEGRHRPMHSLLPIQKGVIRIALSSADHQQTYLVPTGIEYSDFFHYRGTCDLTFGEPIDVNAWLSAHPEYTEAQVYQGLRDELFRRISELILYIPDDEHYEERLQEVMARRKKPSRVLQIALAVITSPLFLLSALLTLPMWATAESLCHFKVKDPAFRNTVRYVVRLLMSPLVLILWAVLFFLTLPWWGACLLLAAFFFSYSFFYDWLNLAAGR